VDFDKFIKNRIGRLQLFDAGNHNFSENIMIEVLTQEKQLE